MLTDLQNPHERQKMCKKERGKQEKIGGTLNKCFEYNVLQLWNCSLQNCVPTSSKCQCQIELHGLADYEELKPAGYISVSSFQPLLPLLSLQGHKAGPQRDTAHQPHPLVHSTRAPVTLLLTPLPDLITFYSTANTSKSCDVHINKLPPFYDLNWSKLFLLNSHSSCNLCDTLLLMDASGRARKRSSISWYVGSASLAAIHALTPVGVCR